VSRGSRSRTRRGAKAHGFTLVEVIVVLVIVALISGALLAAFQRLLDVRLRIAGFLDGTDTPNLVAGWFRDSVNGMIPDVKGGAGVFTGNARRFSGLSTAPLNGMSGVPTPITWQLDYNADTGRTYLRYQAAADPGLTIASWPDNRGRIQYCTSLLACFDAWPPRNLNVTQVPALIRLDVVKGIDAWAILASPENDREPVTLQSQTPASGEILPGQAPVGTPASRAAGQR
jgi:prepilin-type N-terminal cleavage/methylation domain-containing protein